MLLIFAKNGTPYVTDKLFCNRKSFMWPNYYVLEKLLWKQNHNVNENFNATIKFGAYIFLPWYLKKKKNCKQISWSKSEMLKATINFTAPSKTWTRTQKNLDLKKPGLWKTWILGNMDPDKHGIKMGLKTMAAFREIDKENAQGDL